MRKILLLFCPFFLLLCGSFSGSVSCVPVSGMEGKVYDASSKDSVEYKVEIEGGGSLHNLEAEAWCGYEFPGIDAPWTGNTNEVCTVTYTFSRPIYAIDVMIGYVGMRNEKQRESFRFLIDSKGKPEIEVDHGDCVPWEIKDNDVTSPDVSGAFVGIAKISSSTAFTKLTIVSGENSASTGGSSYALCSTSCRVAPLCSTPFVTPPDQK